MAQWKPPDEVAPGEYIGRRIFKREPLAGAADQPVVAELYEISHFEPDNSNEISLDRLGRSSVEPKVRNYLEPRGLHAATKMHKAAFLGWAVTRARNLAISHSPEFPNLPVIASPMPHDGVNDLSENKYHAHVVKPAAVDYYYTALHVREVFLRSKQFEATAVGGHPSTEDSGTFYMRVAAQVIAWWRRLRN